MAKYFPTGVIDGRPYHLAGDKRDKLLGIVEKTATEGADFLAAIENAISICLAFQLNAETSKPGAVRKELAGLRHSAEKLSAHHTKLSASAMTLLSDAGASHAADAQAIAEILRTATEAERDTKSLPNVRLPDYPKQLLAKDVARALRDKLQIRPSKTRDDELASGIFDRCLLVVLPEADLTPPVDRFYLMKQAIALLESQTEEPGLIVTDFPPVKTSPK